MKNKVLNSIIKTISGGLLGFILGYVLILYILLIAFGSKIEIAGVVFFSTFFGIFFGLIIGNLYSYYPEYVNKFSMIFSGVGLLIASVVSMFIYDIRVIFIMGFPILFALIGVLIDKNNRCPKDL